MHHSGDTICACATPPGAGAVSIVRISGPKALEVADGVIAFKGGTARSFAGYSLHYATVPGLDDVMVSIFRAPHSYTGEDSVEISCHASAYVVSELLARLMQAGARMAEPGEFTRRAFLNGKMDLCQAEAVADMIAADSEVSHDVALRHLKGAYSDSLRALRDSLVDITSLLELELDFSEEDVEFADRGHLLELLDEAIEHIEALAGSFKDGNALRRGVPVAIVGAPNCGKSTLLNALLGDDRALVSDIPGTTRDTVEETMVLEGVTYRFIDTAGLRETDQTVERMGIERSLEKLAGADIVLCVVDATLPTEEAFSTVREVVSRMDTGRQTLILLRNKIDLVPGTTASTFSNLPSDTPVLDLSALTGAGLDELRAQIASLSRTRFGGLNAGGEIVTNLRHYEALTAALESLKVVRAGLKRHISGDLLAEDMRAAISSLNSIFGENLIDTDTILGRIFSRFCIGK